jgi:FkbM family methyltransferase
MRAACNRRVQVNLLGAIKKGVRRVAHLEIRRANPFTVPFMRLLETLKQRDVGTVIDVGAHDGGFAGAIFDAGYTGRVISFEPLPDAWATLKRRASVVGPKWTIGPCVAVSDRAAKAQFYVAGNGVSSSLLAMTGVHTAAAPTSRTIKTITVETARLDDLLEDLHVRDRVFLKVDVQGAEAMVLAGAPKSLREQIIGVQLEMSIAALYESQARPDELSQVLSTAGFHLWDIIPVFRDPRTFQLLQYDAVFYRREPHGSGIALLHA